MIHELQELLTWMRENGVIKARFKDMELQLPELPPEPISEDFRVSVEKALATDKTNIYEDPLLYDLDNEEDVPRLEDIRP